LLLLRDDDTTVLVDPIVNRFDDVLMEIANKILKAGHLNQSQTKILVHSNRSQTKMLGHFIAAAFEPEFLETMVSINFLY
jgi:hypothetical protein